MNKKYSNLTKLWIFGALGLIIISFIVLFSGVVIGVGLSYENPNSSFDFAPFGISFVIINSVNIIFNIIMLIIKNNNRSR